jgi:hypothetical protein
MYVVRRPDGFTIKEENSGDDKRKLPLRLADDIHVVPTKLAERETGN